MSTGGGVNICHELTVSPGNVSCQGVRLRRVRAAIYDRVSIDRRQGRSVAEQSVENRAVCAEHGWSIVAEHKDNDRSASRHARRVRESWPLVLADIESGRVDVLVLWESSRGDRELESWARLLNTCRRLGLLIHITSHDRTYDVRKARDWKTLAEEGVANAYASEETSLRIKRSKAAAAAAGRPPGKRPFGYRREYDSDTGELLRQIINEEQAELIREAARRILAGETTHTVAQDFNARGIPTPRGGRAWDLSQVKRIVTLPVYAGKRVHRGEVVGDGQWPAILDELTYYACVSKLSDPARRTHRETAVTHLLSGIAVGACGGRTVVQKNRSFLAYLCVGDFCVSRKEAWVDAYVVGAATGFLARADAVDLLADGQVAETAKAAQVETERLRGELNAHYTHAAAGQLSPGGLVRMEALLLPQIKAAERRARSVSVAPLLRQVARPDIAETWDDLPLTARREVIRSLVTVRILPARRGARSFDPATVEVRWTWGSRQSVDDPIQAPPEVDRGGRQ